MIELNTSWKQLNRWLEGSQAMLYDQDLLRNSWQYSFLESVELIKATPCTYLTKTYEDSSHGLEIEAVVTVEDQYVSSKTAAKHFNRLSFSCTGWSKRSSSHLQRNCLCKSEEAFVSERCLYKLLGNSQVLEAIRDFRSANLHLELS